MIGLTLVKVIVYIQYTNLIPYSLSDGTTEQNVVTSWSSLVNHGTKDRGRRGGDVPAQFLTVQSNFTQQEVGQLYISTGEGAAVYYLLTFNLTEGRSALFFCRRRQSYLLSSYITPIST
jgi:hypothetical protein